MEKIVETERAAQEELRQELRSLFQGAIRLTLEMVLEEELKEMVGARQGDEAPGAFPNLDSVRKVLYLAIMKASERWTWPVQDWTAALNHLSIVFELSLPLPLSVSSTACSARIPRAPSSSTRPPISRSRLGPGAMADRMLEILMAGVSTRKYGRVIPEMADTVGVSKSAVSRETIEASERVLTELMERRLERRPLSAWMRRSYALLFENGPGEPYPDSDATISPG